MKIHFALIISTISLVNCDTTQSKSNDNSQQANIREINVHVSNSLPLFDEQSITRDYLNKHTGLKWKNKMGDWIDLNGTPQGKTPWSYVYVNRNTKNSINIDITALAKEQKGKKDQLIFLSATIPVHISSREGANSPILKITSQNGDIVILKPELDCSISKSTFKNLNGKSISFDSGDSKGLIQFKIPDEDFESAILEFWPLKIYGSGQIEIFNLAPQNDEIHTTGGIASGLPSFKALKNHPDVVFVDTFDSSDIKPEWFWQAKIRKGQVKNGYLSGEIDPKRKNNSAFNLRYFFSKHLNEEPTEIYFRYSVRFHNDFIFSTEDGKLPGQAGTYNTCGWGGRTPSPTCIGWSARMLWKQPITKGVYKGLIPIGTYLYHLDQRDKYGENLKWNAFCQLDQWCDLEQYVKLNTPGKNNGILRGYHNGKLVYERNNIRYRDQDDVKIEDAWLLVYHGGMGFPKKPTNVDIDNVVISKSYIGLLDHKKTTPPKKLDISLPLSTIENNSQIKNHSADSIVLKKSKKLIPNKITPRWSSNTRLAKLGDNTAIDLGTFSCTRPKEDPINCSTVTDFSGMVYDQNHHQILMFGGGHSATFTDSVFIFNLNSLSWKEDYPPTPCTTQYMSMENFDPNLSAWKSGPNGPYPRPISRHTYDLLAVATGIPELILLMGPNGDSACPPGSTGYDYAKGLAPIAHYQLNNKSWIFSETSLSDGRPFYGSDEYTASEYDPVSGMIILLGRYGLYIYDPVKRIKIRAINNYNSKVFPEYIGYANQLVYYPPTDSMYYFNQDSKTVWELKLDRTNFAKSKLKKVAFTGEYPLHWEPGYAYDSVNRIIGGSIFNNKFYIFNPETKEWTNKVISGGTPGNMSFHAIAYDPVNNVFIFITKGFKTWAYRLTKKII